MRQDSQLLPVGAIRTHALGRNFIELYSQYLTDYSKCHMVLTGLNFFVIFCKTRGRIRRLWPVPCPLRSPGQSCFGGAGAVVVAVAAAVAAVVIFVAGYVMTSPSHYWN